MTVRFLLAGATAAILAGPLAQAQPALSTAPAPSNWMSRYSAPAYAEIWRVTIEVPDLKKAVARAVARLAKLGAEPTVPLENMAASAIHGVQQLSYRVPAAKAARALTAVQKLGTLRELQKHPGAPADHSAGAREKLERLKTEQAARILINIELRARAGSSSAGRASAPQTPGRAADAR